MVASLKGRGAALLIEGDSGSGRSRFLDACVLEARLLGATVLRADAADGSGGAYSAMASLGEQLVRFQPRLAREAARLRQPLLASIIPGLVKSARPIALATSLERRHLQTALRDWLREASRRKRIVIAVDDLERIDEPSRAVLAALAHKSERRKLVLAATVTRDAASAPGLLLMRDVALRIELPPLSATNTEVLLGSLFGHAENVAALTQPIFELSGGNPRHIKALVEHLAAHDIARYASGSWTLPDRLAPEHLPASIEATLATRIAALPPGARALGEALSLTDPLALAFSEYGLLYGERERPQLFESLDALVEAGVLMPEGDRYRVTHAHWQALLAGALDPQRASELHARLARALSDSRDPLNTAHHLIESGQQRKAVELMLDERNEFRFPHSDRAVPLIERAVAAADELQLPPSSRLELRVCLLEACARRGQLTVFQRFAHDVLQALQRDCGLSDYAGLDDALDPAERSRRALAAAQRRHEQLPIDERGVAPLRAIRLLADAAMACNTMATSALEPELLDCVPSLEPFATLVPSIQIVELALKACRDHLAGRYARARAVFLEILAILDAPEHAGLSGSSLQRGRLDVLYALGIFEATAGLPSALERVSELEQQPGYRVNAWRVRTVYHAALGDIEQAQRCERRAQLLLLQDGTRPFMAADLLAEAAARFMSDDLDGLKQMRGRLAVASALFPRRGMIELLAHCHYLRIRGDAGSALEQLQPLLQRESAERSVRFTWIGATHVMLLNALERHEEAVRRGRHDLDALLRRGLVLCDCAPLVGPLAEALAHSGLHAEAVELSEALIAEQQASGTSALVLGSCYETRARVALCARDAASFEHWVERCVTEYKRAHNPALAAKLSQLLRDAQAQHLLASSASNDLATDELTGGPGAQATVMSLMAECVDRRERARCALTLLLEETGATEGHLYGWLAGRLTLFGSVPDAPAPEQLLALAEHLIEAELRAGDITADGPTMSRPPTLPVSATQGLVPTLLCAHRDGESAIAGVVVLALPRATEAPSSQLLHSLAESLFEHDDVDALLRLL
jgi:hypothetical protein